MSESIIIHNHSLSNEQRPVESDGIRYDFRGDYLGFTFGGVHSSKLGIVRVSDGDRYNEELLPTFSDITTTVPGLDKTYYFGSTYTQKTIAVKFAFDSLTDVQIREIRRLFSSKEPQDLIFDETPYKVYSVKVNSPPKLSYLCFEEEEQRLYKGDGEINFVAYSPFAQSRFKYLEDYTLENIPEWKGSVDDIIGILNNKEEWKDSSGIILSTIPDNLDIANGVGGTQPSSYEFLLHNPGDLKSESKILLPLSNNDKSRIRILLTKGQNNHQVYAELTIDTNKIPNSIKENIKGVVIDNKTKLIHPLIQELGSGITGRDRNDSTLWVYDNTLILNYIISVGDFFTIPVCDYNDYYYIRVDKNKEIAVDYKYLYY